MKKITIAVLAVLAIIVALLQKTPAAFLQPDVADFMLGLAAGLTFGAVVVWFTGE